MIQIRNRLYTQEWEENMKKHKKHKITNPSQKNGYTEISWIPDFEQFKIEVTYSDEILSIFYKYVFDAAMVTKVNIYLNGQKVLIKTLQDYAKLYMDENCTELLSIKTPQSEVIITPSEKFQHIAFTNGVFNKDGGNHVDSWSSAIFKPLLTKFNKPKKPQIVTKDLKQFFKIFINCTLENPEFTNQSKTKLSAPVVPTKVEVKNINALMKWNFVSKVNDIIKSKEFLTLKKSERKKKFLKIAGFDPANNAGGKEALDCTLILCEGLSAKTYAVVGIDIGFADKKGRDWFGIYPLRGKLLNVRNATSTSIAKNKEITDVIQALGVKHGVDYTKDKNYSTLNYGKIMIMTDADYDGIHISSLIMNLFHNLFPSLLQRDGSFIISMQTPIMKVCITGKYRTFYSDIEVDKFLEKNKDKKMKIKYYKGLRYFFR